MMPGGQHDDAQVYSITYRLVSDNKEYWNLGGVQLTKAGAHVPVDAEWVRSSSTQPGYNAADLFQDWTSKTPSKMAWSPDYREEGPPYWIQWEAGDADTIKIHQSAHQHEIATLTRSDSAGSIELALKKVKHKWISFSIQASEGITRKSSRAEPQGKERCVHSLLQTEADSGRCEECQRWIFAGEKVMACVFCNGYLCDICHPQTQSQSSIWQGFLHTLGGGLRDGQVLGAKFERELQMEVESLRNIFQQCTPARRGQDFFEQIVEVRSNESGRTPRSGESFFTNISVVEDDDGIAFVEVDDDFGSKKMMLGSARSSCCASEELAQEMTLIDVHPTVPGATAEHTRKTLTQTQAAPLQPAASSEEAKTADFFSRSEETKLSNFLSRSADSQKSLGADSDMSEGRPCAPLQTPRGRTRTRTWGPRMPPREDTNADYLKPTISRVATIDAVGCLPKVAVIDAVASVKNKSELPERDLARAMYLKQTEKPEGTSASVNGTMAERQKPSQTLKAKCERSLPAAEEDSRKATAAAAAAEKRAADQEQDTEASTLQAEFCQPFHIVMTPDIIPDVKDERENNHYVPMTPKATDKDVLNSSGSTVRGSTEPTTEDECPGSGSAVRRGSTDSTTEDETMASDHTTSSCNFELTDGNAHVQTALGSAQSTAPQSPSHSARDPAPLSTRSDHVAQSHSQDAFCPIALVTVRRESVAVTGTEAKTQEESKPAEDQVFAQATRAVTPIARRVEEDVSAHFKRQITPIARKVVEEEAKPVKLFAAGASLSEVALADDAAMKEEAELWQAPVRAGKCVRIFVWSIGRRSSCEKTHL